MAAAGRRLGMRLIDPMTSWKANRNTDRTGGFENNGRRLVRIYPGTLERQGSLPDLVLFGKGRQILNFKTNSHAQLENIGDTQRGT